MLLLRKITAPHPPLEDKGEEDEDEEENGDEDEDADEDEASDEEDKEVHSGAAGEQGAGDGTATG